MPAIACTAPGKIILFGEHAVVYNHPAIAAPFDGVKAKVSALANPIAPAGQVKIDAPDIHLQTTLEQLSPDDPIALVIHNTWEALGIHSMPAVTLRITSTIPPAAGLGSSAAVAVALARAVATFVGHPLPDETISQIAFRAEERQHGTPSGIDNTVIAYAKPVYYTRGQLIEFLSIGQPLRLIVADSGVSSSTAVMVNGLRERWQTDRGHYEAMFGQIGAIVREARPLIEKGDSTRLGPLLTENHAILHEMGISCPELDKLVQAALSAGALGAKLSGGGGGGNMIALVRADDEGNVTGALQQAGAVWTQSALIAKHGNR